jgi:hypothetical protein
MGEVQTGCGRDKENGNQMFEWILHISVTELRRGKLENIYKVVVSKVTSQEWSDHFYIRTSKPLVEIDGMIQDMDEVELERYLEDTNYYGSSESLVTGGVETYHDEIEEGGKVFDWEIESPEIRKVLINRKIENILERLTELRTEKKKGWKKSQRIFLEILRELRMKV